MADIADVMDALAKMALDAVFPNGTSSASVLGRPVAVGQGWPLAADLDKAMKAKQVLVSVYAVPSSTSDVPQPFMTTDKVVATTPPGIVVAATDDSLSLTGAPVAGEYITVEIGSQNAYSASSGTGSTAATIATDLASQIIANYPFATLVGSTLTIPLAPPIVVRQGAPATFATRVHRQRMQFRVVTWATTPADRTKVARALDVAFKREIVIPLPDWSQAMVTVAGVNLDDKFENEGTYRRDLMLNVTFDTLDTYQAYEVTTVRVGTSFGF